ncbi:MAG: hypothetical protein OXT74_10560 [Candidatus Poribacteria bacterium]|nr:hypothetical protein [Candidatus Poribacteria bacterium]
MSAPIRPEMPTYCEVKWAVLQHVKDGKDYMFGDIESALESHFELPDELGRKSFPHSDDDDNPGRHGGKIFYKYCNNACRNLTKYKLLEAKGGHYKVKCYTITPLGCEVARRKPCNIVKSYVDQVRKELENASRPRRGHNRGSYEC